MDTIEKDITEILYNLRRIRRKKHLSQKDVAEKMGTTQQVVSKIEMVTLLFVLFTPIAEQLE